MEDNILTVIKRDGRSVEFDKDKITAAILKAFNEVDGEITQFANNKACEISNYIESLDKQMTVEDIQDIVENKLMKSSRRDVAKAYILYRDKRTRRREMRSEIMSIVREKVKAENVQNQNANVDEKSFGGRMGEVAESVLKTYALNELVSETTRYNHVHNLVYIHDFGHYALGDHNCLSIPFDDLLANGFDTRQTDVRPAQSLSTAFQQVAVLFQIQSLQQFGGVSATHIDWTMIPYVRKSFYKHYKIGAKYICGFEGKMDIGCDPKLMSIEDEWYKTSFPKAYQYAVDMTKRETYQAAEGMYHNLNTLQSRSGNQLPFSSINYGTCTLPEGRMVTKALLDVLIKGIGKIYRTSIFPCGIFQCMKGVNRKKGDPNYDLFQLALEATSKRLYPNYANVDWSGNAGYDRNDPRTYFSTMGCRTVNGMDINGFGQLKDGRGNIAPTTIIMPTVAMLADGEVGNKDIDSFMKLLDQKIHEAKDSLLERFEFICSQPPEAATFMYANNTMKGYIPEEGIRSALKHGTLVIGQLGLAETLQILIGCDHTEKKGMELAKKIEALFKKRCAEFKEEYTLNFGVYYTPAENLCYTAMKQFKAEYGEMKNISDRDFFTNSIHVPVWKNISPFEKIDIESQLTGYSNAGCITYVELDGGVKNNVKALETIVNYAMDHDIPYFAVNVPNDTCLRCGFTGEFNDCCPVCGSTNIQQLRRVTGYLTGNYTTAFNKGKQQEVQMRVKHR